MGAKSGDGSEGSIFTSAGTGSCPVTSGWDKGSTFIMKMGSGLGDSSLLGPGMSIFMSAESSRRMNDTFPSSILVLCTANVNNHKSLTIIIIEHGCYKSGYVTLTLT